MKLSDLGAWAKGVVLAVGRAATSHPVLFLAGLLGFLYLYLGYAADDAWHGWTGGDGVTDTDAVPDDGSGGDEPSAGDEPSSRGGPAGVDVSVYTDASAFMCLKMHSQVTYVIVRCYRSVGSVDPSCVQTLQEADKAGIEHLDIYHFPTMKVAADTQVQEVFAALDEAPRIKTFWLDVENFEGNPSGWSSNTSTNTRFIELALDTARDEAEKRGWKVGVGIYSGRTSWDEIAGPTTAQDLADDDQEPPLWWPQYDGQPNLGNWANLSFGGWDEPDLKQWMGDQEGCGAAYDANWDFGEMP